MTMYHQVASWMQFFTLYQSARGWRLKPHTVCDENTRGAKPESGSVWFSALVNRSAPDPIHDSAQPRAPHIRVLRRTAKGRVRAQYHPQTHAGGSTRPRRPVGNPAGARRARASNDRLGTTVIYLNLIDMHVVDEYTQKW